MIRLLAFFTLIQSLSAEHGGTKVWLKEMQELYEKQRSQVPNTRLTYRWSQDNKTFFFKANLDGAEKSYQLELQSGDVIEAPFDKQAKASREPKDFAHGASRNRTRSAAKSPDDKWEVRLGDQPTLKNLTSGKTKQLPRPPKGSRYDSRIHWHADSSCFYLTHRTNHPTYQVHLVGSSPKDQLQPKHIVHNYEKPGDKRNVSQPIIFFTDDRKPIPVSPTLIKNPYSISDIRWHEKGHRLTLAYIERGFGKYRLIEIDANTRFQRVLAAEESDKFVHVFEHCYYRFLRNQKEMLWLSQRTGFNHLYLLDRESGDVIRPLTSGKWVLRDVVAVDEEERTALLQVSGYHPKQDPYHLHYALVNLDTAKLTLLTESDGTHQISFSPDKSHYLAKWSRVDHPPVYEVHRTSDTKLVATLNKPELKIDWQLPERFVCKDRNDEYDIHGVIWRPRNFQKGKKYAVIENIYAGPHGSFVPKSWSSWSSHKYEMAEGGFIVVQIDGLGTNHRGQKFQQIAYKNLKDSGFPDRIKWMKAAAAKHPEMDLTRVGIYGGSAGGQSSTAALLHHPDFYKVAVSDCGCHDNRIDKMWWNEQWLDWPINESYIENSNRTHIPKLQGHLMLTVGELDKNVDPSSTYQIVDDLIKADKDFTFHMIPGAGHGAGEAPHFRRKRIEFFQQHLKP
ncbi:MAG: prolyl oligopeptidase family serine peptidase [Akkermansiaceae bacterium]